MKKILLAITIILAGLAAGAQNYAAIKNTAVLNQFKKAKEDLDKEMSNALFTSKPEAYMLKTLIYGSLSMDEGIKNTPQGDQLADEGDAAFKKFKQMDPSMRLMSDIVYQNGPINLYSSYYSSGYVDYAGKKWDNAFTKLRKAVIYSDLLIEKQLLKVSVDTNVLILAGITAEKSDHKDEAAAYYSRLADKKIIGDGFESVYRFLVSHYFGKKDYVSFEKYKEIGKELYPKSEFFTFDKIDFAVGLETTLAGKVKAVEEVLAKDPNNFKANEWMGEIIYRAFYPMKDDAPEIFDSASMEKKMINAFNKAGTQQPDSIDAFLYLGDHYYKKLEHMKEEGTAHKGQFDKNYADILEKERNAYEKGAKIFANKINLSKKEKAQYRLLAGNVADIFTYMKKQATGKPADMAKYEAEEKKWNDLYESIK